MDPKYIFWDNIDTNGFILFIRDLSEGINTNIKNLVDDTLIVKLNNKKQIKKKKDIIIEEQNKKRYIENIKIDLQKINYLINDLDINDIYKHLYNIKSTEGKIEYKCKILEKLYNSKKKNLKLILSVYFQLNENKQHTEKYKSLITNVKEKITKYDYDFHLYMLKELGDTLPPLNYWDKPEKKLEDWQIETLKYIKSNRSVLVKAPTSSGKSFIALSAGLIHNKIIFVCPAIPVVYQVGSHFKKMGKNIQYLINGHEHLLNSTGNIYIGTPKCIEDNLYKIGTNFNYAVFDEIHNLNNKDGNIYENLLKLFNCNFVGLSASIKNIDFLKNIFDKIHNNKKQIKIIEYNKRFINNQKWVWNNSKLVKLNPLSCISISNIDKLNESNITFTPNDCAVIWETLDEIIEEYDDDFLNDFIFNIAPYNIFKEKDNMSLLTLDDSKKYEDILKKNIYDLSKTNKKVIEKLLNKFKIELVKPKSDLEIIKMLRKLKKNKMFPMLIFNPSEEICENLFNNLYNELHKKELIDYPYHYIILERKNKLYTEYSNNRENYINNIKISKNSNNIRNILNDKIKNYDDNEKNKFITNIIDFYNNCIKKIDNSDNENKINQLKNIKKELNEFIENPDFSNQDVFKKHINYCFTDIEPMDASSIRKIKKEIEKNLGISVNYENPIFQMLKRGIGIYTENMPKEYKWTIQKLLSQKLIGIVITDRTLCQGIDLPIKTVCIYDNGNTIFTKDDILQISGRAGRRGHDTSGNVIYYNINNFRNYIFNENPKIIGSDINISTKYKLLEKISDIKVESVFNNFINNNRIIVEENLDNINYKIVNWLLRYIMPIYDNDLNQIKINIENTNDTFKKELIILNFFNKDIIEIYKNNKIVNNIKNNISQLKNIGNICIILYNNLNKDLNLIKPILQKIFIKTKNIIIKYNLITKQF
jgi:superfamily II RNA helicase